MRIGIDGRELFGNQTGVGHYLASLCEQWLRLPGDVQHDFLLYTAEPDSNLDTLGNAFRTPASRLRHRPVPGRTGVWWEQVVLPRVARHDHLDVFFGPGYSVPLRLPVPRVVTLHDISFAVHPKWFGWQEGCRRRWLARQSAGRARIVITVSEFSRQEIVRHFNLDPARISVVHNGIRPMATPATTAGAPLVLYVGSMFNRRHLPTLIAAFAKVVQRVPDAELVIVGADRTYPRQNLVAVAQAAGVRDRVSLRAHVAEAELARLYGQARVFAYLSEYEGFGMTPLEALASGVPLVVGDTSVAREICDGAARFVPVDDPDAVATELVALMCDEELRTRLLERAADLLPKFTWARAARQTLALLERAAEHET